MKKDQTNGRVKITEVKTRKDHEKLMGDKEFEMEGKAKKNLGKFQTTYDDINYTIKKEE